ncbi:hypothetical protein E1180_17005 [Roseibium denhamense]|uniref:DUF3572 family protein n=1 Tax=Roseibium denhamense TaxID=76305 RepID=A0ABY1P4Y4_9HYPH|nr:hypothetical protein [Roseibium denhamense]MTI07205.1 hypothetical protein [Roseibium denhamense]SMP26621.1 hypothetical protein SAMN06265374_2746 [Roseibium denhamense]
MIKLRDRLDTLEALLEAIDGYQHLPIDTLSEFLLDHYTVDLDVLAQFADSMENQPTQMIGSADAKAARTAA